MKKILFRIFLLFIVLFLTLNVLTIFNISLFGFRIYRIGSGSMEPYLQVNDIILIRREKEYKVNDIITYKNTDNEYITHRIINVHNNKIITKGDANNIEDDPIKVGNVIGKEIVRIKGLDFILYLLNKPMTWIFIFVFGLLVIFFSPNFKVSKGVIIDDDII